LISLWFEFILVSEYDGRLEEALAAVSAHPLVGAQTPALLEQLLSDIILHAKRPVPGFPSEKHLDPAALERRTALWGLWAERLVVRDRRLADLIASSFPTQPDPGDPGEASLVDRMLMVANHYAGRQRAARLYAERVLRQAAQNRTSSVQHALLSCNPRALLSRTLWLEGFADRAVLAVEESVAEALASGNAFLICYTLVSAFVISICTGDLENARQFASALTERSVAHSLEYYQVWARCAALVLAISSGDLQAPEPFSVSPEPLYGPQYLDDLGVVSESLVTTCAIVRAEQGRGGWCAAETLRVKGERLLRDSSPDSPVQAEAAFAIALRTAREQGALSFELRVAMSLARLWRSQGRLAAGHELLSGVYGKFVEGFRTVDLRAARALLKQLAGGE
jgi:hypothetical protein